MVYARITIDHKNWSAYQAVECAFVLIAPYSELTKVMMSVKKVKFNSLSPNILTSLNKWLKK